MKIGGLGVGKTLLPIAVLVVALIGASVLPAAAQPGAFPEGDRPARNADTTVADAQKALDSGDFAKAVEMLKPLAARGDIAAQTNLGILYLQGKGVAQSDKQAAQWLDKAARQGSAPAALDLGILYRNGQGVEKDLTHADMWLEVSVLNLSGQDKADATKYINELAKEMTDSQKQDARDMIDNCMQVGVKYCD